MIQRDHLILQESCAIGNSIAQGVVGDTSTALQTWNRVFCQFSQHGDFYMHQKACDGIDLVLASQASIIHGGMKISFEH